MLRRLKNLIRRKELVPSEPVRRSVDEMIPDAETASYVGGGGIELFKEIGDQLVGWFKLYADLKPTENVLDVGCGIGRIAIPLTQYLTSGSYRGFDIIRHGIEWCSAKITPTYPNFLFTHADVYNQHYNPTGAIKATEFEFPYPDRSFDFVFLTSVFTHMLPRDLEHYVNEISRVLGPEGRCLFTAFIISAEGMDRLARGDSVRRFESQPEGYWTDNPGNPEAAIAYTDTYLSKVVGDAGLKVRRTVPGGWWASPFAQDIVVLSR
jgi:SAM-dependent methyltransferase